MIGETISDYTITKLLGKGAFGEVWAAEQQSGHTRVAIKLLHAEDSTDEKQVDRFFREATAAGKIKHAGIVKIFKVGKHAGRAFLIMELLEGETLGVRISRVGRLPVGEAAEIGRQIASMLEATHTAGIVHRDLKPDNMFLVPDAELASGERVKILDFGLAKLGSGSTTTGKAMGTPAYLAPEQWEDAARVDGRADVYSFGCVVFQLCTGQLPFTAHTFHQWYAKHRATPPPRASSWVPDLPADLDDLIAQMLAKAPGERPQVHKLVDAFARIAAAHSETRDPTIPPVPTPDRDENEIQPPPPDPPPPDPPPPPLPRRRLRTAAVAAGGIAVIAGAVVLVATLGSGPTGPVDALRVPADAPRVPADAPSEPPKPAVVANRWVRIDPPARPYPLGVADNAPHAYAGFRASRGIVTPSRPYEIQTHEVTWSELEPWLATTHTGIEYPPWAAEAENRARLPATNITWTMAGAYCQSLGGELPTEEQWEYAARGPERRPNPWGTAPLDRQMTRAFAGPAAPPSPVMANRQDQAPGPDGPIWDLAGNVQEWTFGLWREDLPGIDESGVQRGKTTTSRTIRGLPLAALPPATLQPDSAAFRTRLCATGPCVEKTRAILTYVGFRCVRPLGE